MQLVTQRIRLVSRFVQQIIPTIAEYQVHIKLMNFFVHIFNHKEGSVRSALSDGPRYSLKALAMNYVRFASYREWDSNLP